MTVDDADLKTETLDPLVMRALRRALRGKWRFDAPLGVRGMAAVCTASRHGRRERSS